MGHILELRTKHVVLSTTVTTKITDSHSIVLVALIIKIYLGCNNGCNGHVAMPIF